MSVEKMKKFVGNDLYCPKTSEYSKLFGLFVNYFDSVIDGIKIRSSFDKDIIFFDGKNNNKMSINIFFPFAILEFCFSNVKIMVPIKDKDELMNFLNDPYSFSDKIASYAERTNKNSFNKCISVCFNILDDEQLIKSATKKK